jgi:integrase
VVARPLLDGEHRGGHRQRVSGVTQRNYQYYIDAYISRIGGESAVYARNPGLLKLFYDSLPNRCAWHVHGVLRMVFKETLARGLVDRNPCMETKPQRRKRTRRLVPSRVEVDKIVAAAEEQDRRWGLFVYLTSVLGTRCGEAVALCTDDFDETEGVVHIERAVSKTAGRPTQGTEEGRAARPAH